MNTLIISKNNNEIGRTAANKKMLLVGRSPACDIVIRGKGIEPVHFLVEYVGAEMPADGGGFWTAIDITTNLKKKGNKSSSKDKLANSGSGEGIVLSESITEFRGFGFNLGKDDLLETELKKGVLKRHLDELNKEGSSRHLDNLIEVVYFRKDIESVTNVMHLTPAQVAKMHGMFPTAPELLLTWSKDSNKGAISGKIKEETHDIFNRGERITDTFVEGSAQSDFNPGDLLHIQTDKVDYYIRAVPNIEVDFDKFGWLRDPMLLSFVGVLAACIGLAIYLQSRPMKEEKLEPPRVVNIETTAPVLVMTPTPTPIPSATPAPTPKPTPKSVEMQDKKQKETAAKKEVPKQQKILKPKKDVTKPKPGLNSPAPVKNVNAVGLLGKFKNIGGQSSGTVSADQLMNQAIVSDTATGSSGFVVQNAAPMGIIGEGKAGSINTKGLTAASTTLESADLGEINDSAIVDSVNKEKFSAGSKIGKSKKDGAGDGNAPLDGMQVQGGLDKDAIRRALAENRRAIRGCYEAALLTKKTLEGKMLFNWVIAPDGIVLTLRLQSSELGLPQFETCVGDVIKKIVFPKSPNNLQTTVIYPFVFQGKK